MTFAVLDGIPVDEELYHTLKYLATPEGQDNIREEIDNAIQKELMEAFVKQMMPPLENAK